jgi:integrase
MGRSWPNFAGSNRVRRLTDRVGRGLVEGSQSGRPPSTYESYRNTMAKLVTVLKHDDAGRVTPQDIVRFKDVRIESGVSPKTVKDSDLAGLKTVFGWAVMNRRMSINPAEGLTIKTSKLRKLRAKGFSDKEAILILKHAKTCKIGGEAPKLAAAKRWVPWLCAFTGARVGEMLQLRKQDVRREGKHWIVRVTPEAGPVKTDEARDVVLHRQIVESGFLDFVKASGEGHLFISPGPGELGVRKAVKTARNKVNMFVREVVPDPHVDPSHGWRHRFKTVGIGSLPITRCRSFNDGPAETMTASNGAQEPRQDQGKPRNECDE